jgi:hypothetical protein
MIAIKRKTPLAPGILLTLALFGCSHGGGSMGMQKDNMDSSMSSSGAVTKSEGMHDTAQSAMNSMKHGDMKHEEMKSDAPMSGDSMDDGKMEKPMGAMKKDGM